MNAARLRFIADAKGKSLTELAALIGVGRRTIYEWAEFDRVPDPVAMLLEVMMRYHLTPEEVRNIADLPLTNETQDDKSNQEQERIGQRSLWE